MIIKKKNLDKITGPEEQPAEEYSQTDNSAQYNNGVYQPQYYEDPEEQYYEQEEEVPQEEYYEQNAPENGYDENAQYEEYQQEQYQDVNNQYENGQYKDNHDEGEYAEQYQESEEVEQQYTEPEQQQYIDENVPQEEEVYQEQTPPPPPPVQQKPAPPPPKPAPPPPVKEPEINIFDLDNIDFSQRQERRRGDRRRGFRRVDDRNLVSRAREEADAIREAAMKEGYQAGLEQAQADIAEVKNALAEFVNAKQEVFEYIAPDILEISVDIAQKIIKKEVEQSPQVIFNTIVDVLKTSLSKEETKVTLRVNPAELNEVKQAIPHLVNLAGIDTKVVVLADEDVTEGGCQVTTTNGIVDATIESRMMVIMQALREL